MINKLTVSNKMAGQRNNSQVKRFSGCNKVIMRYHRDISLKRKAGVLLLFITLIAIMGFTSLAPTAKPATSASATHNRIFGHTQHLTVMSNGDLEVREVIEVDYIAQDTFAGILRQMPRRHQIIEITYKNVQDNRPGLILPPFSLVGNTLNIGDPETFLLPGRHRYNVAYVALDEIKNENKQATLEWNITGKQRSLPINIIHFRVALPPSVDNSKVKSALFVMSPSESEKKPFESFIKKMNEKDLYFRTTRPLRLNESLAIQLSWEEVS